MTGIAIEPDARPAASTAEPSPAVGDPAQASLLALVDQLSALLDRSDLLELEIEAGGTALILRKPSAFAAPQVMPLEATVPRESPSPEASSKTRPGEPAQPSKNAVLAPLTGIFYTSPSPGSAPYLAAGGEVVAGQVIGLIEAMKLFNEIKSDRSGRVIRYVAESGALVKAKQPLLEVQPL